MDIHKNARLTPILGEELAEKVLFQGVTLNSAAAEFKVSAKTAAKRARRFRRLCLQLGIAPRFTRPYTPRTNQCRTRGVAGSVVDLLICSVVHRRGWQIFTTDRDFERYAKVLPIRLYE